MEDCLHKSKPPFILPPQSNRPALLPFLVKRIFWSITDIYCLEWRERKAVESHPSDNKFINMPIHKLKDELTRYKPCWKYFSVPLDRPALKHTTLSKENTIIISEIGVRSPLVSLQRFITKWREEVNRAAENLRSQEAIRTVLEEIQTKTKTYYSKPVPSWDFPTKIQEPRLHKVYLFKPGRWIYHQPYLTASSSPRAHIVS